MLRISRAYCHHTSTYRRRNGAQRNETEQNGKHHPFQAPYRWSHFSFRSHKSENQISLNIHSWYKGWVRERGNVHTKSYSTKFSCYQKLINHVIISSRAFAIYTIERSAAWSESEFVFVWQWEGNYRPKLKCNILFWFWFSFICTMVALHYGR